MYFICEMENNMNRMESCVVYEETVRFSEFFGNLVIIHEEDKRSGRKCESFSDDSKVSLFSSTSRSFRDESRHIQTVTQPLDYLAFPPIVRNY